MSGKPPPSSSAAAMARAPVNRRQSSNYAVSSASNPVLKSLGLEEVDPEDVFELQNKEGAGAFGRVFRACYKADPSRLAALKVIPVALEAGQRGEDIENVRKEIQFLRECDHPNVVAFYGAYYKDGALWVAMEYCGGGSVGDVSRARRVHEHEIAVIMRGALHGLAYLHSKKKIHRDIKGGNILLTTSGQVKIADFGVSAQLRDTMSRRGTFVGTPYWMSPEMIQDSDYDYKSDIWSLGITAIELADQKPPLFDEHPMRVLIQIPRNPSPRLKDPSAWSAQFSQFLQFCLEKDPTERPTALECLGHAFIRASEHIEQVFAQGSSAASAGAVVSGQVGQQASDAGLLNGAPPSEAASPAAIDLDTDSPEEKISIGNRHSSLDRTIAGSATRDAIEIAPPELQDALNAPEPASQVPVVVDHNDDNIAEDISRVDDDDASDESDVNEESVASFRDGSQQDSNANLSVAVGRLTRSSSSSSSNGSSSDDDETGEAFSFRQPAIASAASTPPASVAMISGDELLRLSMDESVDFDAHSVSSTAPAAKNTTSSGNHPPTTFKLLLPTVSVSPTHKSKKHPGERFTGSNQFSGGSSKLDASVDTKPFAVVNSVASQQGARRASPAVIAAAPKSLSSVSSSWQNPLSELQPSHPRLNMLLNSISSSSSSLSSTRLFTKLLQDEMQSQVAPENKEPRDLPIRRSQQMAADDKDKVEPAAASRTSTTGSTRLLPRTSSSSGSQYFVSTPFRVAHNMSVTFNPVEARFEGAPVSEEWAILHKQFGIPLKQMRCRTHSNDSVPALLHMLRRELVKRDGLSTKYIYRVSPDQNEARSIKNAIDRGTVEHTRVSDPHVYASLIKMWLRDLPSRLLSTLDMYDLKAVASLDTLEGRASYSGSQMELLCSSFSNSDSVSTKVNAILNRLPQLERAVLDWLLDHMLEVIDKSAVNKMTARSLAIVLAPNLFDFEAVSTTLAGSSSAANCVASFLCVLIARRQRAGRVSNNDSVGNLARSHSFQMQSSLDMLAGLDSKVDASGRRSLVIDEGNNSVSASNPSTSERVSPTKQTSSGDDNEATGSLEDMVKAVVDGLWIELEAQQVMSVDRLHGDDKQAVTAVFEQFQQTILQLFQQFSKRVEDREWAIHVRRKLDTGMDLQDTVVPNSLRHLQRWIKAALGTGEFLVVLRAEKATKDKLARLRNRYPMECGVSTSSATAATGKTLDAAQTHGLFHQIFLATLDASRQNKINQNHDEPAEDEGDEDESKASSQTHDILLDGALQLAGHSNAFERDDVADLEPRAQEIAKLGEREPTIGNLLAGMSRADSIARLDLDAHQQQLTDMVQSTLRIHDLLQQAV
ncbi:Ste/ste20/mst protein kinase, partial [Globisporangium splendens]